MKVYLNSITGMCDALTSLYMSKRTWTKELDEEIRRDYHSPGGMTEATKKRINTFLRYAGSHTTLLDFVTISVNVEGLHRAGQDDIDAHARRFDNRIIRSSTRLADFHGGEMSDFYRGKIIPTDEALGLLGISLPESIKKDGVTYVKAVNGYIREDFRDDRDVKRGLYMQSIPSNFIFKCNMAQWAHVYRLRNKNSHANPEVRQCVEMIQDEIEKEMPWFNREFLLTVQN